MSVPVIGIDLGTTNSVVAFTDESGITEVIAGKDGGRIVPSVIYFPAGGDPVVGDRARQYATVEPDRVARVFKRGMGNDTFLPNGTPFVVDGKTWRPEELSSLVLRKLKQMAEEHFGQPVTKAVITVPAYFGEPERHATRIAGELAGLEVVRLLNEPTAAAFAHGVDHDQPGKVLVFDLGGGTFDVTIIEIGTARGLEGIATGGDNELGGADFDRAIVERIVGRVRSELGIDISADPWNLSDAYEKAEDIKKELSSAETATRPISTGSRPFMFTLTRAEFESMLSDTVRDVRDQLEYVIENAGLRSVDLMSALLVGGSSRIPVFQRVVQEVIGVEPTFSRNLDEDVARGAAILGAKVDPGMQLDPHSELAKMPVPTDICSHGMGVSVIDDNTGRMTNVVLLPAGSQIPATASEVFSTIEDGQTMIELELNEGDDTDLTFVRQLGNNVGRFTEPRPKGHPVRVDLTYSADQIVRVQAFDQQNGQFICEVEVVREGSLHGNELQAAKQFLADQKVT